MRPDANPLESAFEPTGSSAAGGASARDAVVEDFNAFFERLSSLDNLQWSDDADTAAPEAPAALAAAAVPAAAAKAAPARSRRPMTVLKSDGDLGVAPPAVPPSRPGAAREAARWLRMTLVALLLFALGLGVGWAALSLPSRLEASVPSFAKLVERVRAITTPRMEAARPSTDPLRVVEAGLGTPADQTARTGSPTATPAAAGKASIAAAAPARQAAAENDGDEDLGAGDGIQLPAAGHMGAAPHVAAAGNSAAGPQFALQVGACSSYACVENYRRILLGKVGSGAIKVVKQPRGSVTIQRIRIQPLGRAAGERLKAQLAASDARFQDAYLLALK